MKDKTMTNGKMKNIWPVYKSAKLSADTFKTQLGPVIPKRKYAETSTRDYSALVEMMMYRRLADSKTIRNFERKFLKPVFGNPDSDGNYHMTIGNPDIAFMAHFDSVHKKGGIQKIAITDEWCKLHRDETESNCLGADCATGIWLILEMIRENVPGHYVIHADEETGCKGSRALVKSNPKWIAETSAAISFDRKSTESIITHQMGGRTCSDEFAESLGLIIGLDQMPDDTGSYTDSNEYADDIAECTNLSVGYYSQHTRQEIQDLRFAAVLADRLIEADWSQISIARKPGDYDRAFEFGSRYWDNDFTGYGSSSGYNADYPLASDYERSSDPFADMVDLIQDYPEMVADILERLGYGPSELAKEIAESVFGDYGMGMKQ